MDKLTPSSIAYLMVAAQQLLVAVGWCVGASLMRTVRTAGLYWAAFAAFTGLSLIVIVASVVVGSDGLRAVGNVAVLLSVLALQRGIRCFFGMPLPWWRQAVVLAVGVAVSWVAAQGGHGGLRVGSISALLALVSIAIAWDVRRLTGQRLHPGWGWALAVPLLVGSAAFLARAARAFATPETVVAEVTVNNPLNIGVALMYMTVTLVFQLTLVSLVMSQLVLSMRRLARRDALTGLLNRRAIDDVLDDEAHRARRLGTPFSVLMIDVDHFKSINDRFGHAAGDRALQHLATLLSGQMRDIDRVARYGGEEFIVLLPATTAAEAAVLAERLRERVASLPMVWEDQDMPLTVSIGLAQWAGPQDQPGPLVSRADAALYRAKAGGRNRVEV